MVQGFCGVDPYSGDIYNALAGGGTPSYVLSGKDVVITTWPATFAPIAAEAKIFFSTPVAANVAFERSIVQNTMTINTTVKVFKAISSGEVYVGAHIVENKVSHNQNTGSGYATVVDDRFQRAVAGTKTVVGGGYLWIDKIFTGPVSAGVTADRSFTATLNSSWKQENLDVVVCTWLKNGSSITTLSCEDIPASPSNIGNEDGLTTQNKAPFIVEQFNTTLKISFTEPYTGNTSVLLYSVDGKCLLQKHYQISKIGAEAVSVPLKKLPGGIYIFSCLNGRNAYSRQISIVNKY